MKKILLILLVSGLILSVPVLAQEDNNDNNAVNNLTPTLGITAGPTKSVTRNQEGTKTPILKATGFTGQKEAALDNRLTRIKNYSQKMIARFKAVLERLTRIGERISSRLDKLDQNGITVASLKLKLAASQIKLSSLEMEIAALEADFDQMVSGTDPKTAFIAVKEAIQKIKEDIQTIHQDYVDVIVEIKGTLPQTTGTPLVTVTPIQTE